MAARDGILRYQGAIARDPAIETWLQEQRPELRAIALHWFERMRARSGVSELLHDRYACASIGDAPFSYVAVFKAHVNVGFFYGVHLPDPAGLLEGTGRNMRHVKLRPGQPVDEAALVALIEAAYLHLRVSLEAGAALS